MPRYVVLRHAHPRGLHWDFMLECDGGLATWALSEPPESCPQQSARALALHRLAYLDYEGPVSGDRGSVTRWDAGRYELDAQSELEWRAIVEGGRLAGSVTLRRESADPGLWQFTYASRAAPDQI